MKFFLKKSLLKKIKKIENQLYLVFKISTALCFIGHGVWGLLGKKAWIPYFTAVGISESSATTLMPLIGTVDIVMGFLTLVYPVRIILFYMTGWVFGLHC